VPGKGAVHKGPKKWTGFFGPEEAESGVELKINIVRLTEKNHFAFQLTRRSRRLGPPKSMHSSLKKKMNGFFGSKEAESGLELKSQVIFLSEKNTFAFHCIPKFGRLVLGPQS
jgi:hypothetical protein